MVTACNALANNPKLKKLTSLLITSFGRKSIDVRRVSSQAFDTTEIKNIHTHKM